MAHHSVEGSGFLQRREFLRVGGLSALGLSLPTLWRAEARASAGYATSKPPARAKSCILLFLSGGPPQHETFDPKPDAPSATRSIFGSSATPVPGTHVCELLPDLARLADKYALIRSACHKFGGHFGGHRYALTGYAAPGNADSEARPDDKPGVIGLAAKYLPMRNNVPATVMAPWPTTDQGNGVSGGMGGGTLGRHYNPLLVEADPRSLDKPQAPPVFRIPEFALQPNITSERFEGRRGLLDSIEAQQRQPIVASKDMDNLYARAYDLLNSPRVKEGFDLEREDRKVRDRYGLNAFGQSCLLARRLVERGTRLVQVNFSRFVTQKNYGWDIHDKGRDTLKDQLLPKLNAGLSALLSELDERGLLRETLVVAMGEFGRTPKVKPDGGRDHWPGCYSLLLAGGGIHGGMVYGKSCKQGACPASDPVTPRQILCTMLTLLGIPTFVTDALGRAAPLFEGAEPIEKLYA
jgi:hypothetical protein